MSAKGSLIWQGALALLVASACVSLGFWQLRRLDWKQAMLQTIEARADAAPSPLPLQERWPQLSAGDYEWLHVRARGRFDLAHVALVFTPAPEAAIGAEPGYLAFMPLRLETGGVVIVNRGFSPQSKAEAGRFRTEPADETEVEGWLRPPQKPNFFTPADDPARGKWFSAEPTKIAAAFGISNAAPFVLEQEGAGSEGLVRAKAADLSQIPNNHFGYALIWFGLALALVIIFAVYAKGRLS